MFIILAVLLGLACSSLRSVNMNLYDLISSALIKLSNEYVNHIKGHHNGGKPG